MRTNLLIAASLAGALMACGSSNKSSPAPQAPETAADPGQASAADKAQLNAEFAQLPGAALVRVPVDDHGNTVGQPEMRTVQDASGLTSSDATVKAFDAGTTPSKLVADKDELDGDTSTQSWSGWQNYTQGYGYNSGTQTYSATYGTTYTSYLPTYIPNTSSYGTTYGQSYTNGYGNTYYGCGSYCGGWGQSYWLSNYKPVLYWQGTGWNYGQNTPSCYTAGGYSYYTYTPYKYW